MARAGRVHNDTPRRPKTGQAWKGKDRRAKERDVAQNEKAIQRQSLIQFLAALGDVKLRVAQERVAAAIRSRDLDIPMPSKSSLHRAMVKALTGPVPPFLALRDQPRSGRPRKDLPPEVVEVLDREYFSGRTTSVAALLEVAIRVVAEKRLDHRPTEHQIKKFKRSIDPAAIAAAVHGSRAAVTDAMVTAQVPATHAHHTWTFDELRVPVWVKVFDLTARQWGSTQTDLIIVMDNASRVVVGWHLLDQHSITRSHKTTALDVFGALVGAACGDGGPASCMPFTGHLPRVLRYDRAAAHRYLERTCGPGLERIGVTLPTLPGYRPQARGIVERLVATIKDRSKALPGAVERYVPADRLEQSQRQARLRAAGTTARSRRRGEVPVDALLTIPDLRMHVDDLIRTYHEADHRELGLPPAVAYVRARGLGDALDGRLILGLIPPSVRVVTREGVTYKNRVFMPTVRRALLTPNSEVTFRPDPFLRALFVEKVNEEAVKLVFPPKEEWVQGVDPVVFARERRQLANEYSENTAALFAQMADEEFGAGTGRRQRAIRDELEGTADEDELPPPDNMREGVTPISTATQKRERKHTKGDAPGKDEPTKTVVVLSDFRSQMKLVKGGG